METLFKIYEAMDRIILSCCYYLSIDSVSEDTSGNTLSQFIYASVGTVAIMGTLAGVTMTSLIFVGHLNNSTTGRYLPNLINALIMHVLLTIGLYFNWIFLLLGDPGFSYNIITALELFPKEAWAYTEQFN